MEWIDLDLADLGDFLINKDYIVERCLDGKWTIEIFNSPKARIEIVTKALFCGAKFRYKNKQESN